MTKDQDQTLLRSLQIHEAEPLHKRVPTHDENGRTLSDFMVLLPKLSEKPNHVLKETIRNIECTLVNFNKSVVFAEVNLKLNLLWVSVRPRPGITHEITAALQVTIPEARLVSHV
ncbi:MAG: hypothetical protein OEW89_05425 [Gammaproteobacteria bacterium]|nr:hypothetical protein [Gammaproteobacteria bacterium]MDH5592866.1 hypothetical protein [Gammaproteobacteria bacterium]MDH5613650.1 hypothetical protein [Gammaproteobacteria bacterium]